MICRVSASDCAIDVLYIFRNIYTVPDDFALHAIKALEEKNAGKFDY